jgi:poly(3-hydroxybutyrate) depolymerase
MEALMRTILSVCLVAMLQASVLAQGAGTLTKAEKDALATALAELRQARLVKGSKGEKGIEKASEALRLSLEKAKNAHKDQDLLRSVDDWMDVFARVNAHGKVQKPDGCGRLREDRVDHTERGKEIGFEYAIYLPPNYDGRKAWPLIIALHDKGSTGRKYLEESLLRNDKDLRELREQFVIIAPTIGERTAGKKASDQMRIDWFGPVHYFGIRKCLGEALRICNIDTSRIHLDGCGDGARAALDLASLQPKLFASVAVRNAAPRAQAILGNLKGQAAVMFVTRENQLFASTDGGILKSQLENARASAGVEIEFKTLPALDASKERAALGSQKVDPVTDSNKDILSWFAARARKPFPESITYITDDLGQYKRAAWFVIDRGDADKEAGMSVVVDAVLDRAANAVRIKCTNLQSCRIYLNDRLLDLDKPVKVFMNDKEILESKVERSMDYMLNYANENPMDASAVMVGEVRVTVPEEKPAEPAKSGG